jgi:N6-L-threonylcarbamoyladenine synthase
MKNLVLAIESSCDDSCVALVDSAGTVISDLRISQIKEHSPYCGVVPEIAARAHVLNIGSLVKECLAKVEVSNLRGIAATGGPGLLGGLVTGLSFAKAISASLNKPFIAINHLEGHALTIRMSDKLNYPYLLLLVSGGHCQFVAVLSLGRYKVLGTTLDDSIGEAFDKLAKMLGLGYPGGPAIEKLARLGDCTAFKMPMPMAGRPGCDFSFSGIKTFLRNLIAEAADMSSSYIQDICASFQHTMALVLSERLVNAAKAFKEVTGMRGGALVLSGGVASNLYIREFIKNSASDLGFSYLAPPVSLCTDNAAMIAWAAQEHFAQGRSSNLDFVPKSKWRLDSMDQYVC